MLPFGLRSAPKVFNTLADALEWIVHHEGVEWIFHYLDDFVVIGLPGTLQCQRALDTLIRVCKQLAVPLDTLIRVCKQLAVPLAPEKQDGPTTSIVVLGILIYTFKQELRVPPEKLDRLLSMVEQWGKKKACTRQELEFLIGTLHHACKVIRPGRSFLRRLIALLGVAKKRHHHIRLNREFQSDITWWKTFASSWNGSALIINSASRECRLTSDASGQWGCGAWHDTKWFQLAWDDRTAGWHIAAKELVPIIIASVIWGHLWRGCRVLARCDNQSVVSVVNSQYSKDARLMHMLRCLFFIEAHHQFKVGATHIPGSDNTRADDLSRDNCARFLATPPGPRLDVSQLDGTVQFLCKEGVAASTHRTYKSALKRFTDFCSMYNVLTAFPVSEPILCYCASFLSSHHLSPQTIKTYLAGIRYMQITLFTLTGLPEPETPISSWCGRQQPYVVVFGFLWAGEITVPFQQALDSNKHLTCGDVAVDNIQLPKMLRIPLKQSKTDQLRRGVNIFVGKTDGPICPVAAVLAYRRFGEGRQAHSLSFR